MERDCLRMYGRDAADWSELQMNGRLHQVPIVLISALAAVAVSVMGYPLLYMSLFAVLFLVGRQRRAQCFSLSLGITAIRAAKIALASYLGVVVLLAILPFLQEALLKLYWLTWPIPPDSAGSFWQSESLRFNPLLISKDTDAPKPLLLSAVSLPIALSSYVVLHGGKLRGSERQSGRKRTVTAIALVAVLAGLTAVNFALCVTLMFTSGVQVTPILDHATAIFGVWIATTGAGVQFEILSAFVRLLSGSQNDGLGHVTNAAGATYTGERVDQDRQPHADG